ncbi:MAG: phospholipase D-like domain-containing protein [Gemmataceae bacterium]
MARSRASVSKSMWSRAMKSSGILRVIWLVGALAVGGGGYLASPEVRAVVMRVLRAVQTARQDRPTQPSDSAGFVRTYFTHPDGSASVGANPASALAQYVDQTQKTLDVCAFELDNKVVVDALVRAVGRGVRVRLVTETNYLEESGVKALQAVNVPVVDDRRSGSLMHNKFMVFDNKAVWTGSMNFTENCAYRNNNHGVYIEDERLASNYATKFRWMFENRKFGGLPSKTDAIPYPRITLPDGTEVENYFSTHDKCAQHVIDTIKQAKKSIHFLAFSFTHDGISKAMLERQRAGVLISGVFETTQASGGHSEYDTLRKAGLPVFLDGNPRNMHHKAIIIDGEVVVAGSFNFSDSADKSNDENLVIIHNQKVAQQFEDEFQYVLSTAKQMLARAK